jgi:hypothetical protein
MQLETYLQSIADTSESYFQAHLAREDLQRVERLKAKAEAIADPEELQKEALYLEWTPGDLRTGELKEQLVPLIAAMHGVVAAPDDGEADAALLDAWKQFHEARIAVLIHCL